MENGAFAQRSKCSIFHSIFKNMIFLRRQRELLWSEGFYFLDDCYFVHFSGAFSVIMVVHYRRLVALNTIALRLANTP